MNKLLQATPVPPYWAVIFTSIRTETGPDDYARMADEMDALSREQPGYLGVTSVRNAQGLGITVSYWATEEAVRNWKLHPHHAEAQRLGRAEWYRDYRVEVARVERVYNKQ